MILQALLFSLLWIGNIVATELAETRGLLQDGAHALHSSLKNMESTLQTGVSSIENKISSLENNLKQLPMNVLKETGKQTTQYGVVTIGTGTSLLGLSLLKTSLELSTMSSKTIVGSILFLSGLIAVLKSNALVNYSYPNR